MRRRSAAALVAAALLTVTGCSSGSGTTGADDPVPQGGPTDLPAVTLKPLGPGGKPVDLGDLRGPAVINLWANWCAPCKKEMPIYERFHRERPDVRVIGVNTLDTQRDKARAVAKRAGVTYPLVVDPDQAVRAVALPRIMLVDRSGDVVWAEYVEIKSLGQLEDLVDEHLGAA